MFVNCVIKENIPIEALIDICADVNCISHKYISELEIMYYGKSNSITILNASYFILRSIDLHIGFNNNEKHKNIFSVGKLLRY